MKLLEQMGKYFEIIWQCILLYEHTVGLENFTAIEFYGLFIG